MNIKRIAERSLNRMIQSGKVGLILGARQVGKTTLAQQVLTGRNALFLNFDIRIDIQRFLAASSLDPSEALRVLGSPEILVIDEAQRLPEAARIVKGWYDAKTPVTFLLLGSSSLSLLDQSAEPLTGRNLKLVLPPLLFEEIVSVQTWMSDAYPTQALTTHFAEPIQTLLMQSMAYGAYPEVVTSSDPITLLRHLSSDYLWKDILQGGLVKNPDQIKRLLQLLAHQIGSEVSVHELATQLHMSRQTVEHYLDLLEQTFVVFRLLSFNTNPRKEISKSKKVYFWDTGIRNAILNAFSTDGFRPDLGALWENWVISEIAKRNLLEGSPAELYFWRTRSQSEVDLVCKTGDDLKAFEIKWRARRVAGKAFQNAYNVPVETIESADPFAGQRVFGEINEGHS